MALLNEGMERLRYILSQEPDSDTWEELIECLDNWSDLDSFSAAGDYAEQQLTTWPAYLRTAPSRQWQAIQDSAPLPRWWKLIRHIELGEDDNSLATLPPEILENFTSIKLKDDCVLSPEELRLLASLNKLGSVDWGDLIVSLGTCPADEPIDDILDSAEPQLSNLSDEERTVSKKYWTAIREGRKSIPRWWKLVRHLELGEYDGELLPIEAFTNLTSLDISNCHLIDIGPLAKLTNLTSLQLVDDLVPFDIEPLTHLTQLISLKLALPELCHVNELAQLKNLEKLNLSYGSELTNIESLAFLKKLSWLSLEECTELTDPTPLSQLTALRYLDLSNCKSITDVSPLARLNQLQLLDLAGCVEKWKCYFYVTDGWKVYPMFIPDGDQIISKTYMTRVEGENKRLRHYLARLKRKSLSYYKSEEMLKHSIRLLIHYLKFSDVPIPYSSNHLDTLI